jgi:hypothetical protein
MHLNQINKNIRAKLFLNNFVCRYLYNLSSIDNKYFTRLEQKYSRQVMESEYAKMVQKLRDLFMSLQTACLYTGPTLEARLLN